MAETAATDAAEWNVVITVPEATFREARKFLRRWGEVHRTGYFHVLTLHVDDPEGFLAEIGKAAEDTPGIFNILSHVVPAQRTFDFSNAAEFEAKARDVAILWAPMLKGKSFHVRLHRRGFKGTLSTPKEERFLDEALLDALEAEGAPGHIAFTDPDAILQIETIDGRAGLSLWQREDLQRYPFLGAE
jgi:tRNA(Ser,Leu) C12 N-acetylase TAN1